MCSIRFVVIPFSARIVFPLFDGMYIKIRLRCVYTFSIHSSAVWAICFVLCALFTHFLKRHMRVQRAAPRIIIAGFAQQLAAPLVKSRCSRSGSCDRCGCVYMCVCIEKDTRDTQRDAVVRNINKAPMALRNARHTIAR